MSHISAHSHTQLKHVVHCTVLAERAHAQTMRPSVHLLTQEALAISTSHSPDGKRATTQLNAADGTKSAARQQHSHKHTGTFTTQHVIQCCVVCCIGLITDQTAGGSQVNSNARCAKPRAGTALLLPHPCRPSIRPQPLPLAAMPLLREWLRRCLPPSPPPLLLMPNHSAERARAACSGAGRSYSHCR
jgi:hypothetical protein